MLDPVLTEEKKKVTVMREKVVSQSSGENAQFFLMNDFFSSALALDLEKENHI